ncbi:unnamed protein product [Protopolystoma xenopodis]|uniref:Uncharacterized protein n=1 Tax=Protopolystoma xenopodis TaxID=117903 RepID=A0A448WSE1_9PLAT|nr:unnamed protein product [Protopolystoma xenopodis]
MLSKPPSTSSNQMPPDRRRCSHSRQHVATRHVHRASCRKSAVRLGVHNLWLLCNLNCQLATEREVDVSSGASNRSNWSCRMETQDCIDAFRKF